MKILTRYVMKSFFIPFAAGIFVFSLLIFLGNFFERLDSLIKSPASLWAILQFLWLETPYWMVLIIPIATLTASMLAIGGWIRSREYLAFQAAGIAPAQMLRPLFYCASLVALLSFAAQETVLPYCYWKSQEIFREQIEPRYSQKQTVWTKIVLVGGPGQFLIVEEFDLGAKRMRRVVMDQYEGDRLLGQVDASEAAWDPAGETWVFSHGVQRDFAGGAVREKKFDRFVSNLTTPPQQLIPPKKRPEEMSLRELRRYSKTLKRLGLSTRETDLTWHSKLAYPFANLIVCALAIPFALKIQTGSRALNFAGALGIAFLYWWMQSVGETLGTAGILPPAAGAWLANAVFGAAAAIFLNRLDN